MSLFGSVPVLTISIRVTSRLREYLNACEATFWGYGQMDHINGLIRTDENRTDNITTIKKRINCVRILWDILFTTYLFVHILSVLLIRDGFWKSKQSTTKFHVIFFKSNEILAVSCSPVIQLSHPTRTFGTNDPSLPYRLWSGRKLANIRHMEIFHINHPYQTAITTRLVDKWWQCRGHCAGRNRRQPVLWWHASEDYQERIWNGGLLFWATTFPAFLSLEE